MECGVVLVLSRNRRCFREKSTQAEVFAQIVALVTSVLDGYSCAMFAYGQTGAGKTHTMMGSAKELRVNHREPVEERRRCT